VRVVTEPIELLEPIVDLRPFPRRRAPTNRPSRWAQGDHERCANTCGPNMRCMLEADHDGLHTWRSLGELRVFEWV